MKEMESNDYEPPTENQQIVRVIGSRGNNLHEVESPEPVVRPADTDADATADADADARADADSSTLTDTFLVTMPTKFRKNIWIKRGDFVIVEPIPEGKKVKGEIVRILLPHTVHEFKKLGIWPQKFTKQEENTENVAKEQSNSDDDSDDDELFKNPNRPPVMESDDSDSDESDSDESNSDDVNDSDDEN